MSNTYDGGPAFPAHAQCGEETGMSLRDYFAAKAMLGLMNVQVYRDDPAWSAQYSYQIADAMIAARNQK